MTLTCASHLSIICTHILVNARDSQLTIEKLASIIQSITSSSTIVPISMDGKELTSSIAPSEVQVSTSIMKPSYDELLKLNKEYKEMQHIASLEIDACKTREVAWETQIKELETYKLQTMKMYQKVKENLESKTKEHLILQKKFSDLQNENKKTQEAISILRIRKEKMQEEINTLKSDLNKMKTLLEAQVTDKVPDTPKTSQTISDLEADIRLLVSTNDELNQELEKANSSTDGLRQMM